MMQPPGFKDSLNYQFVCKLHKALYGLKQAPRAWFDKLQKSLQAISFSPCKSDNSLFVRFTAHSCVLLLVYIDEIIITGSNPTEV